MFLSWCTYVLDSGNTEGAHGHKSVSKYKMYQCVFHHLASQNCLTAAWVLSRTYSHLVISEWRLLLS